MKTNSDSDSHDPLLDAVLGDENWQAANATFKAEAIGKFRTRQRTRRLTRWAGGLAVLALLAAGAARWTIRPAPTIAPQMASLPAVAPKPKPKPGYLTDQELLASFPEGSCFLAEIDGKKELIFLDPEMERKYVAAADPPGF